MITVVSSKCEVSLTIGSWAVKIQFHPIPVGCLPKSSTAILERGVLDKGITLLRETLDLHIVNNNIVCCTNAVKINLGEVGLSLIGAESPQSVNVIPEIDETIAEKEV
jgi:hypothetical protein